MSIDVLAQAVRTARKEHACGWCIESIAVGERYTCIDLIDKPMPPYTWREHLECTEAVRRAEKTHTSDPDFGVCPSVDIDGGYHQRGENCPECSDIPVGVAS